MNHVLKKLLIILQYIYIIQVYIMFSLLCQKNVFNDPSQHFFNIKKTSSLLRVFEK